MNAKRAFGIGQGACGIGLIVFPNTIAVTAAGREQPAPSWLVRVLGVRLLGQGCLLTVRPSDDVIALGIVVDAVHGSTMLAAAFTVRRYRRSAMAAAAVAAISIGISRAIGG